jgi:tetratricopeptide (TPR) repeat protein
MSLPLSQLQQLIGDLSASQSQESDLLLMQLDEADAHRLRLCAIPHTFDADVLAALDPALGAEEVARSLEEFQRLPAVMELADCFTLHDVVRQQLFAQWLTPERREEFKAASARLLELYRPQPGDSAVEAASKQVSRLFHLLGADFERGFAEFQSVYQARRDQGRFSDCEALIRLLREYEAVLGPRERGWFAYYRAEVADDNRNAAQALEHIDAVLKQDVPDELRVRALLRSASVLRRVGRFDQARASCAEALRRGAPAHLVHHEFGLIARDNNEFELARTELERAIELAKGASNRRDLVIAYNSLGTLLLRSAPGEAVKLFRDCLALLDPEQDSLRIAQVLNNLGMANAEIREWPASAEFFRRSLEIKRAARDLYGEASTLLNVSRVYRAEDKWEEAKGALMASAKLFEDVHDATRGGQALRELARLTSDKGTPAETQLYASRAMESFRRAGREAEAEAVRREFRVGKRPKPKWLRWGLWTLAAIVVVLFCALIVIGLLVEE